MLVFPGPICVQLFQRRSRAPLGEPPMARWRARTPIADHTPSEPESDAGDPQLLVPNLLRPLEIHLILSSPCFTTGDAYDSLLDSKVLPPLHALLSHISHLLRCSPSSIPEVLFLSTTTLTQFTALFAALGTAELANLHLATPNRVRPFGREAEFLATIFPAELLLCGLVLQYDEASGRRWEALAQAASHLHVIMVRSDHLARDTEEAVLFIWVIVWQTYDGDGVSQVIGPVAELLCALDGAMLAAWSRQCPQMAMVCVFVAFLKS